mmetsp:Transcript_4943/g.31631  ORF Transcript_4943/g.31631 Transcript_4943/m.31631 type:complete len:246 (+) Transcript_4943:4274-5011(+)
MVIHGQEKNQLSPFGVIGASHGRSVVRIQHTLCLQRVMSGRPNELQDGGFVSCCAPQSIDFLLGRHREARCCTRGLRRILDGRPVEDGCGHVLDLCALHACVGDLTNATFDTQVEFFPFCVVLLAEPIRRRLHGNACKDASTAQLLVSLLCHVADGANHGCVHTRAFKHLVPKDHHRFPFACGCLVRGRASIRTRPVRCRMHEVTTNTHPSTAVPMASCDVLACDPRRSLHRTRAKRIRSTCVRS